METVKRWAFDPETDQEYEIEFLSGETVQAALLALDYPAHGMSTNDVTDQLAEHFSLTDRQRNVHLSAQIQYGVFSHLVNTEANNLVRSGQLVKPRRGWFAKPEQANEGSESDSAPSISAVATGDTPVEDNLFPHHTALNRRYFMETVTRTAFDPETDQAYEVELPSNRAVQAALLALDYPARGMSTNDVVNQLAEHFSLTDRQRNARGSAQAMRYKLLSSLVTVAANNLVKSGQLVKPRRGWFAKPEQIREESESDTAASISAVAAGGNPVEDSLSSTAEESIETDYQQIQDALAMETVKRTAFDPATDQAYEVELPSNEAVQAALLALDYPAHGMSSIDAANRLAEYFSLTDRQRNARSSARSHRYGIFLHLVNLAANNLVKSGQLVKLRRGWFAKPEQIREGSELDTAASISAVAASGNPVEDNFSPTAEESIETDYQQIQDALAMETIKRTAFDPETDQAYEVEFPSNEAMQTALLALDYPAHGMSTNDVVNQLAEYFSLTDLQTNAQGSAQARRYKILPNLVTVAANNLVKLGQLVRLRRGWFAKPEQIREESESDIAPSIAAVAASHYIPVEDNLAQAAEESIEENYQQIQDALSADLLQRIQDNSPDFFEELVIDLLVAMGYGGSREEAGRAVGGSGDGGIDGVINEDILGLDVIYVQAKRWQADVGEPPVRDFVGALQGRRARKGIFITTSAFSNRAKEYVSSIDSRDTKIVLIDGHQLAQSMIDYNVGVSVTKSYEIKRVDSDYFAEEGE